MLDPKYKIGQVVRAEWEGNSIKAKIIEVNIFKKLNFIGYRTDTDQFFREEELSTDIRVGDIIKSEFNGIISLVTKTGMENANVVEVECANNGSFRLLTDSEIEHLSESDMQLMKDPLSFCIKKWIPEVNENVVLKMQLAQINQDSIDGYGITRYYTVIMKVKELKQDDIVILEDYSSAKIEDLTPLSNYKGN